MPYQCNLCYWLCQRCIAELVLSSRGIDFPWQQAKWWIDWHLFSTILVLLTTQCTFTKQATFIHLFIQFSMHIAVCIIYIKHLHAHTSQATDAPAAPKKRNERKKTQLAHNNLNCGSTLHRNPATQCSVRTADWNWLITPLLVIFEHLKWKHPRALCQDCISTKTALARFSIQLSGSNEETVTGTVQLDSVTFQVWCDC